MRYMRCGVARSRCSRVVPGRHESGPCQPRARRRRRDRRAQRTVRLGRPLAWRRDQARHHTCSSDQPTLAAPRPSPPLRPRPHRPLLPSSDRSALRRAARSARRRAAQGRHTHLLPLPTTYYHHCLLPGWLACMLLTINYTSHYLRDEGARGLTPSAGAMARREGEQHQHAAAHAVACGACAKWPSGAAPQGSLGQPAAHAALASHIGLAFSTECATCRSGDLVATRRRGPRATAAASCCSAARRPVQTSLAAAAPLAAGAACR